MLSAEAHRISKIMDHSYTEPLIYIITLGLFEIAMCYIRLMLLQIDTQYSMATRILMIPKDKVWHDDVQYYQRDQ